jgi:UPF0176 protein
MDGAGRQRAAVTRLPGRRREVTGAVVASGYRFVPAPGLEDPAALRDRLEAAAVGLRGTILVATEGVNLALWGLPGAIETIEKALDTEPALSGLRLLRTPVRPDVQPFRRLRVRLRDEIVTLGRGVLDTATTTGTRVDAATWNGLLAREDVVLVDARNHYEWAIGRFCGAPDPAVDAFRELPEPLLERLRRAPGATVATYCTGGIRCEKLTAWLHDEGITDVVQLEGGILGYLQAVAADSRLENCWEGDCFVFDDRVALGPDLGPAAYGQCRACHHPLTFRELDSDRYRDGESCPYCGSAA